MNHEAPMIPPALVSLAGYLAERGIRQLLLEDAVRTQTLESRKTDLPAELSNAIATGAATLSAEEIGLVIRFNGPSVGWDCTNTADTIAIAKLFAQT